MYLVFNVHYSLVPRSIATADSANSDLSDLAALRHSLHCVFSIMYSPPGPYWKELTCCRLPLCIDNLTDTKQEAKLSLG